MNILITGIAGLLGSHLADRLLKDGHNVYGVDNLIGGYVDNIPEAVEFIKADCGNLNHMKKLTKNIDIIYHTACIATEGFSVFSPVLVSNSVYNNTAVVITAGITNNIKKIVYCSSMARYGEQEIVPFTEDMIPKPQDPYAISKYAAELMVKNLSETHDINYSIAVPHNIIGPRQTYDDPYRNVASIMINLMLQGKSPYIYGDGKQKRCFSFINDDIDSLVKMGLDDATNNEIINIGPDNRFITINELFNILKELTGFKGEPIYVNDRPKEVKHANCSADKARKLLGYECKTSLEDGLNSIVEYIQTRGPKEFDYKFEIEIENENLPLTWKNKLFNKK
jgi:UDP-glucose 4-epimerase